MSVLMESYNDSILMPLVFSIGAAFTFIAIIYPYIYTLRVKARSRALKSRLPPGKCLGGRVHMLRSIINKNDPGQIFTNLDPM